MVPYISTTQMHIFTVPHLGYQAANVAMEDGERARSLGMSNR